MKKLTILVLLSLVSNNLVGQKQKMRFPIWTTHDKNTDIIGISWGAWQTNHNSSNHLIRTFGVRLETNPLSVFYFMAPRTPLSRSRKSYEKKMKGTVTQKVYGLNISTGSFEPKDSYGISLTGFMHYSRKNNGIIISGLTNSIERANGIVIGFGGNEVRKGNGISISSVWGNHADTYNGIQIAMENQITGKGVGIQIGLFNKAKNFKGLQLGLWNKNDRRSFPFINWQFKP